jgi:hypothetical protein
MNNQSHILQPFTDARTGEELRPEDGDRFLHALHGHVKGDYVFATEVHDEADCPFSDMVIPLQPVDVQRRADAVHQRIGGLPLAVDLAQTAAPSVTRDADGGPV